MGMLKYDSTGSKLLYASYLGGSDSESPHSLIMNANEELIVLGTTSSSNFPRTTTEDFKSGDSVRHTILYDFGSDIVVSRISKDGTQLLASTYIYAAGGTTSSDFPKTTGSYQDVYKDGGDGWIAKIAADGSAILNVTFTGTKNGPPQFDQVYFLDIDVNDEPYVYGITDNKLNNFPVTSGVYSNPKSGQFIQKFDSTLTTLRFSTVFGSGRGIPDLSPTAFLVNECNNIYLSGWGGGSLNDKVDGFNTSTTGLRVSEDAIITPDATKGLNDKLTIQFGDTAGVTPADHGFKVSVVIYNRWGTVLYETDDYQYNWSGEGLASGIYYYEVTVEDHTTCKSWIQIVK